MFAIIITVGCKVLRYVIWYLYFSILVLHASDSLNLSFTLTNNKSSYNLIESYKSFVENIVTSTTYKRIVNRDKGPPAAKILTYFR